MEQKGVNHFLSIQMESSNFYKIKTDGDDSVVIDHSTDVKDVFVREKVYSVEVKQDFRTTSITFVSETLQAIQSDIAMPVQLFRRDDNQGSLMV